jgi:hypothetical protein
MYYVFPIPALYVLGCGLVGVGYLLVCARAARPSFVTLVWPTICRRLKKSIRSRPDTQARKQGVLWAVGARRLRRWSWPPAHSDDNQSLIIHPDPRYPQSSRLTAHSRPRQSSVRPTPVSIYIPLWSWMSCAGGVAGASIRRRCPVRRMTSANE